MSSTSAVLMSIHAVSAATMPCVTGNAFRSYLRSSVSCNAAGVSTAMAGGYDDAPASVEDRGVCSVRTDFPPPSHPCASDTRLAVSEALDEELVSAAIVRAHVDQGWWSGVRRSVRREATTSVAGCQRKNAKIAREACHFSKLPPSWLKSSANSCFVCSFVRTDASARKRHGML